MASHVRWSSKQQSPPQEGTTIGAEGLNAKTVTAKLGIARMAYLMGGRAAEDLLQPGGGTTHCRVDNLLARPGKASGDLRKAQQVAERTLELDAVEGRDERERRLAAIRVAYAFAEQLLRARWQQVCALSGALVVRGTVDGSQLRSLLECQASMQRNANDRGTDDRLLGLLVRFPFAFGCMFAATKWPSCDSALPGPGEPSNSLRLD